MATTHDLVKQIQAGARPVITFKPGCEDMEDYQEPGMKARILGASSDGEMAKLQCDFGEFDGHNATLEQSNYFDKEGKPTLTARQAGHYKPVSTIYVMLDDPADKYFDIDGGDTQKLMAEHQADGAGKSYVAWLEQELIKARGRAGASS